MIRRVIALVDELTGKPFHPRVQQESLYLEDPVSGNVQRRVPRYPSSCDKGLVYFFRWHTKCFIRVA